MREQLVAWGHDPVSSRAYESAMAQGTEAIRTRDWPAAVEAHREARRIRPHDHAAARRLAGLFLLPEVDRPDDAADVLLWLARASVDDNRYAKRAARLFLDKSQPEPAIQAAWLAVRTAAYDREAHELLLDAARRAGDSGLVADQERRLALLEDRGDVD
jgi:hypothetical protein